MNDAKGVEILLVEDNPHDAELAVRALHKHHITNQVTHVEDGQEALDFLFGRGKFSDRDTAMKPKVVLLDLKLPRVDGLEVLKKLKGDPLTRGIPVVVLTSSREETDLVESYNLGANSYLVKPVDFQNFSESMKDIGYYWLLLNQLP